MINRRISESEKFAALKTDSARMLYMMMMAHLDVEGRYGADAHYIKGNVAPRLKRLSPRKIRKYLKDMDTKTGVGLIKLYGNNGDSYLQYTRFEDHQSLRKDRESPSTIPAPPSAGTTPAQLQSNSGVVPEVLQPRSRSETKKDKFKLRFETNNKNSVSSTRLDSDETPEQKAVKLYDCLSQLLGVRSKGDKTCYRRVSNAALAILKKDPASPICSEIWERALEAQKNAKNPAAMFVAAMQEIGILEKKRKGF